MKLKYLVGLISIVPFMALGDTADTEDCPVGGKVFNPITLEETVTADFGIVPVKPSTVWLLLDTDGEVYEADQTWHYQRPFNFFKYKFIKNGTPATFEYNGTEGARASITIENSINGCMADNVVIEKSSLIVEDLRDYLWPDNVLWETDAAEESKNVGVLLKINKGARGDVTCNYKLKATYL